MTAETFPFLASIMLFLASPLLVMRAKRHVANWLADARPAEGVDMRTVPAYLAPEQIGAYVEYAADVVQIVPAITLTGVGVVVALPGSLSPQAAAAWMLAVVLLVVAADTLTLAMPPQRYLRRKVLGISFVALVGILVNAVALVITAVWAG